MNDTQEQELIFLLKRWDDLVQMLYGLGVEDGRIFVPGVTE